MPYNVRERFHRPDGYFYNYGERIAQADEAELEERGLLARFCTQSEAPKNTVKVTPSDTAASA